ncbi:MAG: hypothetical protein DI598_11715 [Pseudopedobacter saltans]|uniref:Beta-lactamase-inhibitor-like PepSY-like domain-containing protein n=1 Tax=Pseudopedobacter saltans TaxID=151895 RepID=A0A2W5EY37_9SPHI|nr:MAG: hypothetical protein DI598_11715 [Pseudopedobacter saltans]
MKKLFIIAAAFIAISLQVSAKSSDAKDDKDDSVSSYVHSNSSKMVWSTSGNFNVASFTKEGYKMKAFFDEQGSLVSTTRMLKNRNELPKVALDKLDKDYAGWGMTDLIEEKGMDKELVYYARVTDGYDALILKITSKGKISKF